jgi:proteasome accessory factor B
MPASKTERLMNLVICLLASGQYVTKERLRATLEPYRECPSDEAFERMFERDKDDLREMGIPLEIGSNDAYFDDEIGYRIPPGEYALPELQLEPDEAAVLGVAARFWQQAALAGEASSALLKLKAGGSDVGDPSPIGIEPRVRIDSPAFEPLLRAITDRRAVAFDYRRSGESTHEPREVEPWSVASWRGRWYLAGFDRGRQAMRVFRLDRVSGPVRQLGKPGTVAMPAGVDVRAHVESYARSGSSEAGPAKLRVREGAGFPLRRRASRTTTLEPGWDLLEVSLFPGAEAWLVQFGADIVVLEPPELRAAVMAHLRAAAEGGLPANDTGTERAPDEAVADDASAGGAPVAERQVARS